MENIWTYRAPPTAAPFVEGFVEVGGSDVPYNKIWFSDTGGSGETIILLHSGALSASGWCYQQPVLAANGFRVVTFARRGFFPSVNASHVQDNVQAFSKIGKRPTATDDLRSLVLHLKLSKYHLVGAALGGWFAADYALSFPDDVLSLVIVASQLALKEPDWLERNARLKPDFFANLPADFKELSPSFRAGCPEGHDLWLSLNKEVICCLQTETNNVLDWKSLESIRTRVLLVAGESDLYVPPSLQRMLLAHFKNVRSVVVSETGHNPYFESPEVFNRHLLDFLREK